MTTILQINSAARSQGAQSTLLSKELTDKLQQANPGARVVVRDLHSDALPHLDDSILGAFFTPADKRTPEQQAISARSEALIETQTRIDSYRQLEHHGHLLMFTLASALWMPGVAG